MLSLHVWSEALQEDIGLHLSVHDTDTQRGSLQPDARGQKRRGTAPMLQALLDAADTPDDAAPRQSPIE